MVFIGCNLSLFYAMWLPHGGDRIYKRKNAGNIIMKNLMDFCIGTLVFILLGYGIINSEHYFFGLIGLPMYQMFSELASFDWPNFFFPLLFCATSATIVSGAMAERTKFISYCICSAAISAVIDPLKRVGCRTARAGWQNWAMRTSPTHPSSTWLAASPP